MRKTPGLFKRGDIWWIDKQIRGRRIQESTGTTDLEEAERYLVRRLEQFRKASVYGERPRRTFQTAAIRYLKDFEHKVSIEQDANSLAVIMPYIGHLFLDEIHDGTIKPYIDFRKSKGYKSSTVKRDLAIVRRILRLAAQSWRDEHGLSWLDIPPLLQIPDWKDARKPRPISWKEQEVFFEALPPHLHDMALFKVNTGCREQEVCGLCWDWEYPIPELKTSVFIIPAHEGVKNGEDRIVVLNDVAKAVIDRQRGIHEELVFTYKGARLERMNNTGWRNARIKAKIKECRVHDLKHTFGLRLRAAGVTLEDRKALLGHTNGDITTHYSAVELTNLIAAANKIVPTVNSQKITLLKPSIPTKSLQSSSRRVRRAARK